MSYFDLPSTILQTFAGARSGRLGTKRARSFLDLEAPGSLPRLKSLPSSLIGSRPAFEDENLLMGGTGSRSIGVFQNYQTLADRRFSTFPPTQAAGSSGFSPMLAA